MALHARVPKPESHAVAVPSKRGVWSAHWRRLWMEMITA